MGLLFRFGHKTAGSRRSGSRKPADTPSLSGETDLLRQQMGVPERGNNDQLVAHPLGGLAEFDVERLSCPSDHLAVWQNHLAREGSRGIGNHGDPVAASELNRIWIAVDVNIREHANQL